MNKAINQKPRFVCVACGKSFLPYEYGSLRNYVPRPPVCLSCYTYKPSGNKGVPQGRTPWDEDAYGSWGTIVRAYEDCG